MAKNTAKTKKQKKQIYCIMGRTAAGKSTFAEEFCRQTGKKQLRSFTTRPPRPEEVEKEKRGEETDHVFITKRAMTYLRKNEKDPVMAYTKIGQYEYCTTLKALEAADVYVIDPKGVSNLKKRMEELRESGKEVPFDIVEVYIRSTRFLRRERFCLRGGSPEGFMTRDGAETKQFDDFETGLDRKGNGVVVVENDRHASMSDIVAEFLSSSRVGTLVT